VNNELEAASSILQVILLCGEGKGGKAGRKKGRPSSVEVRMYLNLLKRTSVPGHMLHLLIKLYKLYGHRGNWMITVILPSGRNISILINAKLNFS
jgi:hypothetical protein